MLREGTSLWLLRVINLELYGVTQYWEGSKTEKMFIFKEGDKKVTVVGEFTGKDWDEVCNAKASNARR